MIFHSFFSIGEYLTTYVVLSSKFKNTLNFYKKKLKKFTNFELWRYWDKQAICNRINILSYNIFMLYTCIGLKWQNRRKLLTHTFHIKTINMYSSSMNKHSRVLAEKLLEASANDNEISIWDYVTLCSLDMICGMLLFLILYIIQYKIIVIKQNYYNIVTNIVFKRKTYNTYKYI